VKLRALVESEAITGHVFFRTAARVRNDGWIAGLSTKRTRAMLAVWGDGEEAGRAIAMGNAPSLGPSGLDKSEEIVDGIGLSLRSTASFTRLPFGSSDFHLSKPWLLLEPGVETLG
jgi:hypothetical protein